uniref:Uncharacterized protein n=1 Tax=Candidatus Giovannonibacteria bacterium GW2011_GWF2_42_19 TaxID=1618659 RepID=A0A0G0ZBJ7_9BACT|nr:MAG: hypothetical protein UV11_C0035G0017 [Candidatus Giovannonibacteria bacterium GW2011_GWF2_42_19]
MAFLDIFKKKKTKTSSKAARREEHFHKSKEGDKSEEEARVLKEDKAFSEKAFRVRRPDTILPVFMFLKLRVPPIRLKSDRPLRSFTELR